MAKRSAKRRAASAKPTKRPAGASAKPTTKSASRKPKADKPYSLVELLKPG